MSFSIRLFPALLFCLMTVIAITPAGAESTRKKTSSSKPTPQANAVANAVAIAATKDATAPLKPIRVLLVDGQNNHDWKLTSPLLRQQLLDCGRFTVDTATSPAEKEDMSGFRPKFSDYDVVVSNYTGADWPRNTQIEFQAFVQSGGGFVVVHAADNAFPDWPEYNEMIGIGGWGGRTKKSGPYVYYQKNKVVIDTEADGSGGGHGSKHEFVIRTRDFKHPIMQGIPETWLHTKDELYEQLRGPAKNMNILASAFASPKQRGSGRHEPILMTLSYGEGRVFHTTLGHLDYSIHCVGFRTTLVRGTEWAATGEVTLPVPDDFPTAKASSTRE